ncbi:NADH-quinone oxidoreductase subunit G [Allofranklinella schreckenbergeri]|uniref:NADH-quinone oxidoreductase n=1 Tax=Allofranklinella schreckenbergeri TaxID=1076744 RepID=A0A3M6QI55_9BURK|nr:NADH-quinone oxidoreductase subunit NuoG [Allofranklinella schreckenbergeri]RMX02132.1 NADH-quinone oxidoreductase subunit G [Allofranklinella schreckenbergeri]RRD43909.1 NADH-quinone oxidoreductase subunit G [Comamonadaceae bacterium OH3737_COT-264]
MIEIELDGKKVEVQEGSMVMHAAEKSGTYIPHFCYHKKLSIAASCRMCLVEVEKAPKPLPACATPVTQGMVVHTHSAKAVQAQQSVMEFLLINHPLDCPICDQGGECQLQDLAVGYGAGASRYQEEKRAVRHKDVGPLISMEEMSRCIHCTRCVRFGQEVAGVMELGMINRGEFSEITTVKGNTVDSELSGNMIDICPVGALTSKPFRYNARTWELSRRKSVAPHDSSGANLVVQVKNHRVMRVLPLENEAVNECWIADRDRFSYEALNGSERLSAPMIKQGGQWLEVGWQQALEYIAQGLGCIRDQHGAQSIGALVSPHSTLEEMLLIKQLMNGLGSDNIDHRLRHAEFSKAPGVRWLGTSIASLSTLEQAVVIGSNLRKEHPLFAARVRHATRAGAQVYAFAEHAYDWAMPVAYAWKVPAAQWLPALAGLAAAVAAEKGISSPFGTGMPVSDADRAAAQQWLAGSGVKAILLGNAVAHHEQAEALLAVAQWLGAQIGASVGYLTEAANTVGAQWVGVQPQANGLNAAQMLAGGLKAAFLLNVEPQWDSAAGANAVESLKRSDMVVTLSPFKTNLECSDVLLPVSPFTETSGTFVNAEGRVQSFHAVVKPLDETRPAWKVLRVLGNLMGLPDFDYDETPQILARFWGGQRPEFVPLELLNNTAARQEVQVCAASASPTVAAMYQLDGIVRRAPALQATRDARLGERAGWALEDVASSELTMKTMMPEVSA